MSCGLVVLGVVAGCAAEVTFLAKLSVGASF